MLEKLLDEIKELQADRKLLDEILWFYNATKCEFVFISDKEFQQKAKRSPNVYRTHPRERLKEEIDLYRDRKHRREMSE